MSYRVEQAIKGTIYVYEATSYWDKEKKRPGQKRKIIGKRDKVTGELILNAPKLLWCSKYTSRIFSRCDN